MRTWRPSRRRVLRAAMALVAAPAVGACRRASSGLPVLPFGGDFVLTDHDGGRFDSRSLRGRVVLVFFGYSSCPDACPTTLSKLAVASRRLGEARARVKTLYVSVDPARDTPAALKADLANFSLDALGLTGTKAEIDAVVSRFGASYEIVPTPESASPYTVSHSTWVYAIDTAGRTRIRFPYEASVEDVVDGLQALLADRA